MKTPIEKWKKAYYFFDEFLVFFVMFVSIILSDAVMAMVKTGGISGVSPQMSWVKVTVVSTLIAIIVYGSMNGSFKYSDKNKPPLMKRLYNVTLQGVAYKTLTEALIGADA